MFPALPFPEPSDAQQPAPHWLRLSLQAELLASAPRDEGRRLAWRDRLHPDLRQFLMAYSATFVAAIAFIA